MYHVLTEDIDFPAQDRSNVYRIFGYWFVFIAITSIEISMKVEWKVSVDNPKCIYIYDIANVSQAP